MLMALARTSTISFAKVKYERFDSEVEMPNFLFFHCQCHLCNLASLYLAISPMFSIL